MNKSTCLQWNQGELNGRVLYFGRAEPSSSPATKMQRMGLTPGVSFFKRVNTIGFDMSTIGGSQNVVTREFCRFLKEDLKVVGEQIKVIQIHPIAPYSFVKFFTEEQMEQVWLFFLS